MSLRKLFVVLLVSVAVGLVTTSYALGASGGGPRVPAAGSGFSYDAKGRW